LILFSGHHYVGSISIVVVVSPPPEYEPQITLRTQGGGATYCTDLPEDYNRLRPSGLTQRGRTMTKTGRQGQRER